MAVVAPKEGDAAVDGYAVKPCRDARFASEAVHGAPDIGESFLIEVVEIVDIGGIHIADLADQLPVFRHEAVKLGLALAIVGGKGHCCHVSMLFVAAGTK